MVLEQFLTLAVGDLLRAGMFTPSTCQKVKIEWYRGTDYASITAVTDLTGFVAYAVLSYYDDGRPVEQGVTLRWRSLYNGGGYYYFVCPVSGLSCQKLYYSRKYGQFVGRVATGAGYLHKLPNAERAEVEARPYRWRLLRENLHAVTI